MRIGGEWFDSITEEAVADRVIAALAEGRGGRILTPNVDILRLARSHGRIGAEVRGYLADATLIVADGMPLVWASRLAGTPLPERVTGSGLIWTLSAALGRARRSIYVLGGKPVPAPRSAEPGQGASRETRAGFSAGDDADGGGRVAGAGRVAGDGRFDGGRVAGDGRFDGGDGIDGVDFDGGEGIAMSPALDGAERAAATLAASCPGLDIAGHHAPRFGFDRDPDDYAEVLNAVIDSKPDFVFVGLGFPKQERIISDLRAEMPETWFLGCGAAVGFVAGETRRAPFWMQRSGLEWAHRLAQEPGRLAGRYLAHDAPYALKMLATAGVQRVLK